MSQWISQTAGQAAPFLLDVGVKSVVVLLAASAAVVALRKSSAAARHALWSATMAALVLLPAMSLLLPARRILPQWSSPVSATKPAPAIASVPVTTPPAMSARGVAHANTSAAPFPTIPLPAPGAEMARSKNSAFQPPRSSQIQQPPTSAVVATRGSVPTSVQPPTRPLPVAAWFIAAHFVGAGILLALRLAGALALWRLSRRVSPVTHGPWTILLRQATTALGITRPVALLEGEPRSMPMTWGTYRPRVLLPADATAWTAERRRVVLLHELGHVKRLDCLTQLIASIACALYWFNPLVWLAAQRMRVEREQACDDLVLSLGNRETDYAEHLVQVAATLRSHGLGFASTSAVAMARSSRLEGRVRAILDPARSRRALGRVALAAVVLALAGILLPVSMLKGQVSKPNPRGTMLAKADAVPLAEDRSFELTLIDAVTKKPVGDASVGFNWDGKSRKDRTDDKGRAWLGMPEKDPKYFSVSAKVPGYVPVSITWRTDVAGAEAIPNKFTLELAKGTTIGGIIRDEAGKPVEGATVFVLIPNNQADRGASKRVEYSLSDFPCKTDKEGKWKCDVMPPKLDDVWLRLAHNDYVSDEMYGATQKPSMDELRKGTGVMVMKKGLTLAGIVTDSAEKAIVGAKVVQGSDRWGSHYPETMTDEAGKFSFGGVRPGPVVLTVQAKGFGPDLRQVAVAKGSPEVRFKLDPAKTLKGRVVDATGAPVKGAFVAADTWRGNRSIEFRVNTDADGRFEWTEAPADAVIFHLGKQGYQSIRDASLAAGDKEHLITLRPPTVISGTVTDAETGKPIDKFTIVRGGIWENQPQPYYDRYAVRPGAGGKYEVTFDEPRYQYVVRIEAEGYAPAVSPGIKKGQTQAAFDAKLKKGVGPVGVALLSDGKPAADAQVVLCTPSAGAYVRNGHNEQNGGGIEGRTDAAGKFSFPPQSDINWAVLVLHEQGYGWAKAADLAKSNQIKLEPWAVVTGVALIGSKPAIGEEITLSHNEPYEQNAPRAYFEYRTAAGKDGKFRFDKVKAGEFWVSRVAVVKNGPYQSHTPVSTTKTSVKAGQTLDVQIGGKGRPVIGKIGTSVKGLPEGFTVGSASITTKLPDPPKPAKLDEMTQEQKQEWFNQWSKTVEAKLFYANQRNYSAVVQADGTIRAEDIEAGEYNFGVYLNGPFEGGNRGWGEPVATGNKAFKVPEIPGGRSDEPLDIGTVDLKIIKRIKVGEAAPAFEVKTLDGKTIKLEDYKGKFVLLDFWATWCGPCIAEMPSFKDTYAAFGNDPRFALIGLSLDKKEEDARKYVEKEGLKWTQGFLDDWEKATLPGEYGVNGIPSTWLIGPDGKVIARDLHGEAIKAAVEKALAQK